MNEIPKIIHQLWKTRQVPLRWQDAVETVQRYHRGWQYRLWTDAEIDEYVATHHPDFHPAFASFQRQIMRVDVFRYILMHDIGGLYCDLDYEFVRRYDYGGTEVVLCLEHDEDYGYDDTQIANFFMASAPGHAYWKDMLDEVKRNPPVTSDWVDVYNATGPGLTTRVFLANRDSYQNVRLTPKPVFSPERIHGRKERSIFRNSGVTYGFHHGWGSWKERLTPSYLRKKAEKIVKRLRRRIRALQQA